MLRRLIFGAFFPPNRKHRQQECAKAISIANRLHSRGDVLLGWLDDNSLGRLQPEDIKGLIWPWKPIICRSRSYWNWFCTRTSCITWWPECQPQGCRWTDLDPQPWRSEHSKTILFTWFTCLAGESKNPRTKFVFFLAKHPTNSAFFSAPCLMSIPWVSWKCGHSGLTHFHGPDFFIIQYVGHAINLVINQASII